MCLGPCLCVIEFLPYICLVSVPLYGAFCGVDVILRFSLLLYIHSFIVEYIPKSLFSIIPYLQIGLLGALALLPINLTPWLVVWLYDKVLWTTEPLLLLAEVVLVQNLVMRYSQEVVDYIEDELEEDGRKWKAMILGFSTLCYACVGWALWSMYEHGSTLQLWLLFLVILLCVAVHNMMWMAQEGTLSDAAFATLCSVMVVYAMMEETSHIRQPLQPPPSWNRSYSKSLIDIFVSIINMKADSAMKALLFFRKFLSPFFLVSVIVRLYSILFIVEKVTKNFSLKDEFENQNDVTLIENLQDENMLSSISPWKSPLILRVSVIFMFTQLTTLFLSECSGGFLSMFPAFLGPHSIWPTQILIGRIFQVLAVNGFYMWRLYRADDWSWCEWLTP